MMSDPESKIETEELEPEPRGKRKALPKAKMGGAWMLMSLLAVVLGYQVLAIWVLLLAILVHVYWLEGEL